MALYFLTLHIHLYINYPLLTKASRLLGKIVTYTSFSSSLCPNLVVRGVSLAFSRGGHFKLSFSLLSFSTWAQMLVAGLGPDHDYSIGSRPGSQ